MQKYQSEALTYTLEGSFIVNHNDNPKLKPTQNNDKKDKYNFG